MKIVEHLLPIRALLMMGALLMACAPVAQRAWAADPNADNANVENLLDQARFQGYRLGVDTDHMTGLIRSEVSWEGKADELTRIKLHVNDLGKLIAELQSSRVDASPWQKEAIDATVPLLREVAAITTREINFLRAHEDWPNAPKYTKWANESARDAHELADMISETVQYGEDRAQLAELSDNLHLQSRADH